MSPNVLTDVSLHGGWFVVGAEGLKRHVVHKCLLSGLIVDLESRGYRIVDVFETHRHKIDFGGSIFVNTPVESFDIDTLTFVVFSHQVAGVVKLIERYDDIPRKFEDGSSYFKLHNSWTNTCVVLTPEQRSTLLATCATLRRGAERRFREFVESWNENS